MTDVTVKLVIPIPCEPLIGAPSLTFASWVPIGEAKGIAREQGNIALKIWFDLASTWRHLKEEELQYNVNVLADRLFAQAVLRDTPDELATYMSRRDFTRKPTPEEEPLQQQYDDLAYDLFVFVVGTLNRFLAYVRSKKGQYWLSEYPMDKGRMSSYYGHFEARLISETASSFASDLVVSTLVLSNGYRVIDIFILMIGRIYGHLFAEQLVHLWWEHYSLERNR